MGCCSCVQYQDLNDYIVQSSVMSNVTRGLSAQFSSSLSSAWRQQCSGHWSRGHDMLPENIGLNGVHRYRSLQRYIETIWYLYLSSPIFLKHFEMPPSWNQVHCAELLTAGARCSPSVKVSIVSAHPATAATSAIKLRRGATSVS